MSTTLGLPRRSAPPASLGALVAVAIAGLAVAGAEGVIEGIVRAFGRNIPQPDLVTDYAVGCVWAIALGASLLLWPVAAADRRRLILVWAAKALVTLGVMLAYEWNYEFLDAYSYFRAAFEPHIDAAAFSLGAGTETINAIAWLHARLLSPSYHALKVSFAFVGLLATWILYRGACLALDRSSPRLFYFLAFFPSMLFWSSIVGKDPVVLLGIAVYCYGVLLWYRRRTPVSWLVIGAGVIAAMGIRLWLGPILIGPLVVLRVRCMRSALLRLGVTIGAIVVGLGAVWRYRELLLREVLTEVLTTANTVARGWAEGGSGQVLSADLTNPATFLAFLPRGMFTALFRPLPGEVMNPFGVLAGLESLVLLGLLALAIVRTRLRDLGDPLTLWGISLVLAWSGIYSVLSYQNLGTAVRFRLQIIPVMLGLFLWQAWGRREMEARGLAGRRPGRPGGIAPASS